MTLVRLVILNPSTFTLSKAKSLRTSSVKDLWQSDPLPTDEDSIAAVIVSLTAHALALSGEP